MTLTRDNVTAAARIMLPTYPVFFAVVGLGLLLTPTRRLAQTPAFDYANRLAPLGWWGAAFLVLAAAFVAALLIEHRRPYQIALAVAVAWMTLFSVVTALAAFRDMASFSAWVWSAFVARACYASLVSLEVKER